MQVLIFGLFMALAAGLIVLFARLRRQRELLQSLAQDQERLAEAWRSLPAETRRMVRSEKSPLIGIEILNPIELAARESSFAGPVGTVAPDLIRRIVYQRTADILRSELREKGVQAEVTLHGLA